MRLKQGVAVAGTHGKTTTTSLTAAVLNEGGLDPTFVIGGRVEAVGSNARLGTGEFIVVEADESDASFLYLQPCLAVVTNIDADHMETYDHSVEKLREAFVYFLQRLPFYGVAVSVHRRSGRARDRAAHREDAGHVRPRARSPDSRRGHRSARRHDELSRRVCGERSAGAGVAGHAQSGRRSQRPERARGHCGRTRAQRAARENFGGAGGVQRCRTTFPAVWRRATARGRRRHASSTITVTTRRRWRRRLPRRAVRSPAAGCCSPSSRIVTRERATASKIS